MRGRVTRTRHGDVRRDGSSRRSAEPRSDGDGRSRSVVGRVGWWTATLTVVLLTGVRFIGLEEAPPGFFRDEAHIATHAICIQQTGHDADGRRLPLFSRLGGGGWTSPAHVYPLSVWARIFGHSIPAFRAYAGVTMSLAMLGLFLLARVFMDSRGALYVLLAAGLSPWLFHFGRVAFDSPGTVLAGAVWGMYFFLRPRWYDAILSATCFTVSAYGYPAARVALPFLLVALLALKWRTTGVTRTHLVPFILVGAILCAPLAYLTVRGDMMSRFDAVGIWSLYPEHGSVTTLAAIARFFLGNVLLHVTPDYLFRYGDPNLRLHSQFSGQLSWLDTVALLSGILLLGYLGLKDRKLPVTPLVVFCLVGFLVGIVPAALTWEGLPHSFRSLISWPFVALLTGFIIWKAETIWRSAVLVYGVVAVLCAWFSVHFYFGPYAQAAGPWFDWRVKEAAVLGRDTGDWSRFRQVTAKHDPQWTRYFVIRYRGEDCDSSAAFFADTPATPAARNPGRN